MNVKGNSHLFWNKLFLDNSRRTPRNLNYAKKKETKKNEWEKIEVEIGV